MRLLPGITLAIGLATHCAPAMAHTPLFSCFDNGDGTITCEGGFSDGSSASGVAVHIKDASGATLQDVALDGNSEITFQKPQADYTVQLDAGEGHQIDLSGKDIAE